MAESSILTKAMALMDRITEARSPLTLPEITEITGWPRSSVHRLLVLLRDADALSYDPERQTYSPGSRLMRWGVRTQTRDNIAMRAAPHMRTLCRDTNMRVALSVRDGQSVLFVHTEELGAPFRLAPRLGEHSPLHVTAGGKLFLSEMFDAARKDLLADYELELCTEFTITDADRLAAHLEQVRRDGYATSLREEFRQICGIAVPIRDDRSRLLAALSLWTVSDEGGDDLAMLQALLPQATQAASAIQTDIGHKGT